MTGARTGRAIEHRKIRRLARRDCESRRRPHRHHRHGEGMEGATVSKNPCTFVRGNFGPISSYFGILRGQDTYFQFNIIVRYADDFVVGCQRKEDAEQFLRDLKERLGQFALDLHPDKTRLIEFGRFAMVDRRARGARRPETFDFLGFTHYCRKTRNGGFGLGRKPIAKRVKRTLKRLKERLRARMHEDVHDTAQWLGKVVNGWLNYYAVPTSAQTLRGFIRRLEWIWLTTLRRRSQKTRTTIAHVRRLATVYWPSVRVRHPWPDTRFAVNHPRWEPYALARTYGSVRGDRGNPAPYRNQEDGRDAAGEACCAEGVVCEPAACPRAAWSSPATLPGRGGGAYISRTCMRRAVCVGCGCAVTRMSASACCSRRPPATSGCSCAARPASVRPGACRGGQFRRFAA